MRAALPSCLSSLAAPASNYVLQRTPGTSYVSTNLCGPAPLNTALGGMAEERIMGIVFPAVPCRSFAALEQPAMLRA